MAEETRPTSRATARSDSAAAPPAARCRRAVCLISSVISARIRARSPAALPPACVASSAAMRVILSQARTLLLTWSACLRDYQSHQRASLSKSRRDLGNDGGFQLMALHVIVGAGPVGSATAACLVADGHRVRMITRSGSGPAHPAIERVAADATDGRRLSQLAAGAEAIYNCANPPYHRWPRDWPPLAAALLQAAEETGAVLATVSNLYGYGPVDGPITPDLPLRPTTVKGRVRATMWEEAFRAHQSGRIRATEVRASDYLGPGTKSIVTEMLLPSVRRGRRAHLPVDFDVPHSLTFVDDAARTLVAVARDERGWGKPWH